MADQDKAEAAAQALRKLEENFHTSQRMIKLLLNDGADDAEIKDVMIEAGIGHATVEQFLNMKDVGDFIALFAHEPGST